MEPLKLMEPRYVFYGTLGFRGTPVEEHWSTANIVCFKSPDEMFAHMWNGNSQSY